MLVINCSARIARLFAEIFEKRGWNVVTCGDRDSAMEQLAGNTQYDAILLSYRIPDSAGFQLIRLTRSMEHRRRTPIIMVTDTDEVTDEALAAGADEVLLKPINPNALTWVVEKLVE
jgi:two-component system response regulator HydG